MGSKWTAGLVAVLLAGCGTPNTVEASGAATPTRPTPDAAQPSSTPAPARPQATAAPGPRAVVEKGSPWENAAQLVASRGDYTAIASRPTISADGARVAYAEDDSAGSGEVYVRTVASKTLRTASTTSTGERADYATDGVDGDDGDTLSRCGSFNPSLSADGRMVAFDSSAINLVPEDTNRTGSADTGHDVFVKDLHTGAVVRASVAADGTQANGESTDPSLSADGSKVAFVSTATNLVPGDIDGLADVFVKDLRSGAVVRASVEFEGRRLGTAATSPALSGDGSAVAFVVESPGPTGYSADTEVAVMRLDGGTLTFPSRRTPDEAVYGANGPSLSFDGSVVAFGSRAALLPGESEGESGGLYVRDLPTGKLVRASTGSGGGRYAGPAGTGALSGDGRWVVFVAGSPGLANRDRNRHTDDVLVKDLRTDRTYRVADVYLGGSAGISRDGRRVVFLDGTEAWNVHVLTRRS